MFLFGYAINSEFESVPLKGKDKRKMLVSILKENMCLLEISERLNVFVKFFFIRKC